jgi:hypothetical protein
VSFVVKSFCCWTRRKTMNPIESKRLWAAVLVLFAVLTISSFSQLAFANTPPVACISEGGRVIEATGGQWEARVTLDASCSSDADSAPGTNDDINDFAWYEVVDICDPDRNIFLGSGRIIECNLPFGAHVIILNVTDSTGASDSNEAVFTVEDLPPLPPLIKPNEPNAPAEPNTAIISSGSDSNIPQEGASNILPASQSPPPKSGKIIGLGVQATPNQELFGLTSIAAGGGHSLALKSDGTIVGWGANSSGQSSPLSGSDFVAIAAGGSHSLALKSDGTIVGWGYNSYGQSSPPSGSDFMAIAAGAYHSLALKSDGSIVGWGWNIYGQSSPPSGSGFMSIAAGEYHSLAIVTEVSENKAPVACIVNGDRIIEAGSNCESRVILDGGCSSDEDSTPGTNDDIASFDWYEANSLLGNGEIIECNLPLGEHIITLKVTDEGGASDSNEVVITVVDTTPPVIVCPNNITVAARWPSGAAVNFEVTATDLCDSQVEVVSIPASGSIFAPGETTVICTAADDSGNSSSCSFMVSVIAPVEMPMHFTPGTLNPGSKGNWMKAHFVLPDGYEISDIDVNTPAVLLPLGIESNYITVFVDRGRFGESGVEIGFERSGFCDALGDFGPAEVTVSARLTNGQYFYGTDVLRVIANDFESLSVVADYWLANGCTAPGWCGGADIDASGAVDFADFALFDACCVEVF